MTTVFALSAQVHAVATKMMAFQMTKLKGKEPLIWRRNCNVESLAPSLSNT